MDCEAANSQTRRPTGAPGAFVRRVIAALLLGTLASLGVALFVSVDDASGRIVTRQGALFIVSERHFGWPAVSLELSLEHRISTMTVFPPPRPRIIDAVEGPNGFLVPTRINHAGIWLNAATFAVAFLLISAITAGGPETDLQRRACARL